ncbi:hypothetical protein [Salinicola tamaricis]|uniref:hypothetical protein n=1 Tax=Salinicola tamaricis TaxID=1771309 RepID=UPI001F5DEBE7|nr:hypothetical protein [Salinicola tamaricis]
MRPRVWIPLALVMLLSPLSAMAEVVPLDRIVAVVTTTPSCRPARAAGLPGQEPARVQQHPGAAGEDPRASGLDRMITEQIELQMAEKGKLNVDETQLNATMRGIAQTTA